MNDVETDPDIWNVMTVNANADGMTRFVQFESTYNSKSVVTVTDTGEYGAPYTFNVTKVVESTGPGSYLQVEMTTTLPATMPYATKGTLSVHATNVPVVGEKTWSVRALFATTQVPRVCSNAIAAPELDPMTNANQEMFVPIFGSWNVTGGQIVTDNGSHWRVVDAAEMQGKVRVVVACTDKLASRRADLTDGSFSFSVTLNSSDATIFPPVTVDNMPPPPGFAPVPPCTR